MLNFSENRNPPGVFRKILMFLAFAALGYLGNYLSLPIAFSVTFIFGSIFAMIAVAIMGIWWGVGVSIIASSYTYQLWNHPYAIIIFTAEILWIGLALRRGKKNILLIDSLYWLILGIPLVIAFYSGAQQLDAQDTAIIALKQALNGAFNAMAASIILSHTPLRRWTLGKESTRLPTYSTIIFHLITISLMAPSLSLLLYMNHREAATQQSQVVASIQANAHEARVFIQVWVGSHVNAARVIAGLGEKYPLRPSPGLQEELKQIHKLFPGYYSVFLGDANAITIAHDPPVNTRGESTIGINFADRAWFKQLRNTLKPGASDVFVGRAAVFEPIFTISVPVVRDKKLVRFGLGTVNLKKLSDHLATFIHGDALIYSLVDRNGNLIASSDKTRKPLAPVAGTNNGTVVNIAPDVGLWVPGVIKHVSIMNVWKSAYYFTRLPIDETNWTLLTEHPVAPMQKYLYSLTTWCLGGVAALYSLSILFALILSRRLARVPKSLSLITKDLSIKIDKQDMIVWPHTDTVEMEQLTNNFMDMESTLRRYVGEIRQSNVTLEQKVQERTLELKSERQRLGDILYGTNVGTWEWNVQTGETIFNERWANIIGYGLNELEPVSIQTWIDFTHPDDLKGFNELLEKHFKEEIDYYEYECRMKHKDGHWVWVLDRGRVITLTNDSKPLKISGTRQDITERKQMEAHLQQSQKMESIGTLTGGIAHDFNNIVGIIIGNTELVLDDVPESNPVHSNLEEIKTASLRAAKIVKQLISFSRKTDQKLQPIEIAFVIKDALKFLRSTIPITIDIQQDIQTTDETILADPTQINQIMMNLCINASQAMEQTGGVLKINMENVILDEDSANGYPDLSMGNYVKITVSDTGPGIAPEIIDRIFEPYFTTKEVGKGSGMGLAVVLGIVKSHDGAITVDSQPGEVTTFSILFEVVTEKPEVKTETTTELPKGSETILVVDDEKSIVAVTQQMLGRLGYKVETAMTPQDALDLFSENPEHFDLVITDMTMPQMTGVALSEKLMGIRPDIPIIISTGHSALVDEKRAKELGLAAYVMKPISMREIATTIRKVLDKK